MHLGAVWRTVYGGILAGLLGSPASAATASLLAVARNGVPLSGGPVSSITIVPGDTVTAEMYIAGWGNDFSLGGYQFRVLGIDGVGSGTYGRVVPLGWDRLLSQIPCVSNDGCAEPFPLCQSGTCVGPDPDPSVGAFIEQDHPRFIFATLSALCAIATASLNYDYFCVVEDPFGVPDPGEPRYAGTLILEPSTDACGSFTFAIDPDVGETFLFNIDRPPVISRLTVEPLVINVSDCAPRLIGCNPEHCWVDARIAHPLNAPTPRFNLNRIDMLFTAPFPDARTTDFDVTVIPGVQFPPTVSSVIPNGENVTVVLSRRIEPENWTCVRHIASGRRCCLGSLPGDADGNRRAEESDVTALVENLRGRTLPPLEVHRCDTGRSGLCTGADVLTTVDVLNCGAVPCETAVLPFCPSMVP